MNVHYVLEDVAHARFVPAMFERIAAEFDVKLQISGGSPEGGASRAVKALRQLLADIRTGIYDQPDVIVLGIDADCGQQGNRSQQAERARQQEHYQGTLLTAEPDPHIEIWYLADPAFVQQLLQIPQLPPTPTEHCKKDEYKEQLRTAVLSSGAPAPLGGVEYGPEIAMGMDLYRAMKNVPSLSRFVEAAREQCSIHQSTVG